MKKINKIILLLIFLAGVMSCQKMERPVLGDYPKDANPPGGPLKFYAAFNGTTKDPLMNAVDSIRANFPSSNVMTSIDGISGKAVQGDANQFVKYASPNDFASAASDFTVAFWEKRNGMPNGNAAFAFNISSTNGHWAKTTMMLLFDHAGAGATNDLAVLKFVLVDAKLGDTWLTWEGSNKIQGIQNNNWHHLAFVYSASASSLTLYVDGVANAWVPKWGTHGAINMDASKVNGLFVGGYGEMSGNNLKDLGWGMNWGGGIDQFRLYNKALSASEVAALFSGKQ